MVAGARERLSRSLCLAPWRKDWLSGRAWHNQKQSPKLHFTYCKELQAIVHKDEGRGTLSKGYMQTYIFIQVCLLQIHYFELEALKNFFQGLTGLVV